MTAPPQKDNSRYHFLAVVLVTLIVMILGVLVVVAPDRMGVPRPAPTTVATPAATESN